MEPSFLDAFVDASTEPSFLDAFVDAFVEPSFVDAFVDAFVEPSFVEHRKYFRRSFHLMSKLLIY